MQRNPKLTINGKVYQTIGDVHLGRKYINGVPLHMRGAMEKLQREKFLSLLATKDASVLVLVGDLFDSFIVDPADVDFAASSLLAAARDNPTRRIVVLGGNHDESKDLTRKSSFDNFKLIVREANLSNIDLIETPTIGPDRVGYVSWSATHSAKELAEQLVKIAPPEEIYGGHGTVIEGDPYVYAVFGHWDVVLPSNANHYNMVPTEQLKAITNKVITGHVHKPDEIERDGVTIQITGSIIPLAHGEELESDEMFYTITRTEYDENPEKYDRKFVRFVLAEDEDLPEGDFLQIKAYVKPTRPTDNPQEDANETVVFDVVKILTKYLTDNGVSDKKAAEVVENFNAKQDRD